MIADARAFRRVPTPLQREIHLVIRIALPLVIYGEFLQTLHALIAHTDLGLSVQNLVLVSGWCRTGCFSPSPWPMR
jgi:hypothetical protein